MTQQCTSTAELPRHPIGEGETAERIFAQAADELAARRTAPSHDALPDATTRHLGGEARGGFGSRLRAEVQRARGARVAIGPYDIIRCIGAGGMGVVYEAVHRKRGQRVALKTLQQMSASALYRFKNEFREAQSVVHPNLCALYELVSCEDEWFFTMEYVEGASFLQYIRGASSAGAGGFDEARLRAALLELARGVRALHEASKLHRDLNSSNVLVTEGGRVVILDFGLISGEPHGHRAAGSFDVLGGTPGYMAPEQAAGEQASTASDWYAVGVMLYEALTGRLPFLGTIPQVLIAKRTMDPAPPAEHCRGAAIPDDLDVLCRSLLLRTPKERPQGREVLRRLGGHLEPLPFDHPAASGTLIGREEQTLALTRAYAAVSEGLPRRVHVEGPSGIGKTALVRRFLSAIDVRGRALVLMGRCSERESVPYKALDALIDALAQHLRSLAEDQVDALLPPDFHELARVFPVLHGVHVRPRAPHRAEVRDPHEVRRRASAALKELLRRLGAIQPLVLFIDDVHWSDPESAWLLFELLARPDQRCAQNAQALPFTMGPQAAPNPSPPALGDPPALLLITASLDGDAPRNDGGSARSIQAGSQASPSPRLRPHTPGAIKVHVPPLSHEQAIELALRCVRRSARETDPDTYAIAERIATESAGNPFLINELGRHAEQVRRTRGVLGDVSLASLVEAKLSRLDARAESLLSMIIAAGRPIEQELAIEVSEAGPDAHAALVRLRASHLIRGRGIGDADRVQSYNDRLGEAVLSRLSPERRRDCHLRLARALSSRTCADPEAIAHHFAGAGLPAEASSFTEVAAARAEARLAFDRAAQLYAAARALLPHDRARFNGLLVKQADALVNAERCADAARLYLSAADGAPPLQALDLRRRAAEQLLVSGHVDEGIDILRPVLEAHGLPYPNTLLSARVGLMFQLARLRLRGTGFRAKSEARIDADLRARISACWAAGRGLAVADPTRAAAYVLEALLLALRTGDLRHAVPGLAFVGSQSMFLGTRSAVARGVDLITQAEELAAHADEPYLIAFTSHCRGRAHFCVGEWRQTVTAMDQSVALLRRRCAGIAWERSLSEGLTGQALLALGELAERSRRAHARLREADEISDVFAGIDARVHVAFDRLIEGDPEGAREGVRAAMAKAPPDGFSFQRHFAAMVEAQSDLYEGRAAASLSTVEAELRTRIGHRVQVMRIELLRVRGISAVALAARDTMERPRLLRLAAAVAASLDREGRPHAAAAAALIRAGVAWAERRPSLVTQHLLVALTRYEAAEMKLHAACARRKLGELSMAGDALIADADAALTAEGVASPSRWATMYTGID